LTSAESDRLRGLSPSMSFVVVSVGGRGSLAVRVGVTTNNGGER
jgi:hypothetical protein